ncbi:MAG: hypothetical protein KTR19_00465 [Hyphomicrobiales bacterium]|nr:hypothetical protein [Hyphomicrobiales bacterium]
MDVFASAMAAPGSAPIRRFEGTKPDQSRLLAVRCAGYASALFAVAGKTPSYFVDPQCPVEQVSRDDAQRVLDEIKNQISDPALGLLTEAQWEYVCRTPTSGMHFGDVRSH